LKAKVFTSTSAPEVKWHRLVTPHPPLKDAKNVQHYKEHQRKGGEYEDKS